MVKKQATSSNKEVDLDHILLNYFVIFLNPSR